MQYEGKVLEYWCVCIIEVDRWVDDGVWGTCQAKEKTRQCVIMSIFFVV